MAVTAVTCFGGNNFTLGDPCYDGMVAVGSELAMRDVTVVTGGYGGIMEAVSRGAAAVGGRAVGHGLAAWTGRNAYCTEFTEHATYGERLQHLLDAAGAFIVAPGGTGTMLEWLAAINANFVFWNGAKRSGTGGLSRNAGKPFARSSCVVPLTFFALMRR